MFLISGLLLIGYSLYDGLGGRIYQAWWGRELDRRLDSIPPTPPAPHLTYAKGSAIGRLEIPRLGLSVVVLEGSDQGTLRLGVGRVRNSSLPGEPGNVVLAGHRDTFFRSLRLIRAGDRISVRTAAGTFSYTVDWTKVVKPTDVSVIMPTPAPALTLITCYPFYYIGSAPERFIVRALPPVSVSGASTAAGAAVSALPPFAVSTASMEDPPAKPSPFAPLHPRRALAARATVRAAESAVVQTPERGSVSDVLPHPQGQYVPPDPPTPRLAVAPPAAPAPPAVRNAPAPDTIAPDIPLPQRPGPVKRAFHKFTGLFARHRDKLQ